MIFNFTDRSQEANFPWICFLINTYKDRHLQLRYLPAEQRKYLSRPPSIAISKVNGFKSATLADPRMI